MLLAFMLLGTCCSWYMLLYMLLVLSMSGGKMNQRIALLLPCFAAILCHGLVSADEPAKLEWKYSVDLLRPFWQGTVIHGESGAV